MTHRFLPGTRQWRCAICHEPTDQRHHTTYVYEPENERWVLVPLCDGHHARLHRAYDAIGRCIPLPVFSAKFISDPEGTEVMARIVPASRLMEQLSFADQATPQGEHWRRLEAKWAELWEGYGEGEHDAA